MCVNILHYANNFSGTKTFVAVAFLIGEFTQFAKRKVVHTLDQSKEEIIHMLKQWTSIPAAILIKKIFFHLLDNEQQNIAIPENGTNHYEQLYKPKTLIPRNKSIAPYMA